MSTTDAGAGAATKGPIAWFARNPVAANLLLLFLIIGGVIAGRHLAVQLYPYVDLRTITVTVPAPGSSPKEVEEDINRRIEEAIVGLRGVERVVGTANEGRGHLRVELETFADPNTVLNDVQNAVDGIENFPPLNAERPEVQLHRISIEVLTLAVSSSHASEDALRLAAENVRDELLALPSVSQVTLLGTRDREITIELSEEELRRHNLSIAQISRIVRRASLNLTFGELRTEAGGVVLQTITKRRTGAEFKDIPLITRLSGAIVTLGDVATIRDGFVDEQIVSEVNGQPTVFVRVDAVEQESVVEIGDEIKMWLAGHKAPGNIAISIWNDRAAPALDRLQEIIRNGILGALLVFLTLVLVFDLRVAIWITVGIPLSFIGSLIFLRRRRHDPEHRHDLRLLPAYRHRRGRLRGGRREHRGGTREREEPGGCGDLGRQGDGGSDNGGGGHHPARLRPASLRHLGRLPAHHRLSLRGALRPRGLARRVLLRPARTSVARPPVEPVAVERHPAPGGRADRPGAGLRGGAVGGARRATSLAHPGDRSGRGAHRGAAAAIRQRPGRHHRPGCARLRQHSGGSASARGDAVRADSRRGRAFRGSRPLHQRSTRRHVDQIRGGHRRQSHTDPDIGPRAQPQQRGFGADSSQPASRAHRIPQGHPAGMATERGRHLGTGER